MGFSLVPWVKKFGPGKLIKASHGEFSYKEDDGHVYYCQSSLYWDSNLEGKHYDWLKVHTDVGWVKRITGKETLNGQAKRDL